jgi:hypothetical protein
VWQELLSPHLAPAPSSAAAVAKVEKLPGSLRFYEFEEAVLNAFDTLALAKTSPKPKPIDGMGGQVWDALLSDSVLISRRIHNAWSLMHAPAAANASETRTRLYRYPQGSARNSGMNSRRGSVLKVWGGLQFEADDVVSSSGGVRGARFDVVRSSMDWQMSKDSAAQRGIDMSREVPVARRATLWRSAQVEWQRHCSRVAAAAAEKLHARTAAFSAEWTTWNEKWVASLETEKGNVRAPSSPSAAIDVFSMVPEDSDAALRRCASLCIAPGSLRGAHGTVAGDVETSSIPFHICPILSIPLHDIALHCIAFHSIPFYSTLLYSTPVMCSR